jgi:hypothetical protein
LAKSLATAAVVGLVFFTLPIALAAYRAFVQPALENASQQIPFEQEVWKANTADAGPMWPTRLRMADDLVQTRRLMGKSRAEVVDMLGPRDNTTYYRDWDMVYHLGPERGPVGIDSEWLVIRLDHADRVREARIERD